jgi:beta-glucosidase
MTTLSVDGLTFRDLDHDGVLSPYEDHRLSSARRADDLLSRMTLAEKAGTMAHGSAPSVGPLGMIGVGTEYDFSGITDLVLGAGVTSMITRLNPSPAVFAEQNNEIQRIAATGRLGIPVTISSDPRHHVGARIGASVESDGFSQWPDTLGFGAIGDTDLVRRFGDIVRQEYRAVGIQMALSPQADLATSPRWPRIDGTFGEDPRLVRALVGSYVEGMQAGRTGLNHDSVATVVKHWVGYGASRDGFDGHNWYGRYSAFPTNRLQDHIDAFLDAFEFHVSGVMPTYNILDGVELDGREIEQVGAGHSHEVLTGLLRGTYAYDGVILSDWGITREMSESCRSGNPVQTPEFIAMPWGVETLSRVEKFAKCINAGVDQIGGDNDPTPIVEAVTHGLISEARVDDAVRRILIQKFDLGLFDNPFVDSMTAAGTAGTAGNSRFAAEAFAAQQRSLTRIKRSEVEAITTSDVVFVDGMSTDSFESRGINTTSDVAEATVAVIRISAPFEVLHPNHFFGQRQHEGRLDFADDHPDLLRVAAASTATRTIVVVGLDRPAVLTPVVELADTIIAEFGASEAAIVSVLCGGATPEGRLPFRLPASMDDALTQPCDGADESIRPLFGLFHSV